jgi:hypothetical protein
MVNFGGFNSANEIFSDRLTTFCLKLFILVIVFNYQLYKNESTAIGQAVNAMRLGCARTARSRTISGVFVSSKVNESRRNGKLPLCQPRC